MRVLYVTNMFPSSKYIYRGIHVKEQIDYLTNEFDIEFEVYFIDGTASRMNYFRSIYSINRLMRTGRFDLIHIHFGLSGIFLLFNPFAKVPSVLTIHGSDIGSSAAFGLIKFITKTVVKRVNRAIVLNDKMVALLKSQAYKLVKIPCGINLSEFYMKRNNIDEHFLIGFPGAKTRLEKNYILFKRIIDVLVEKKFNIKVVEFHNLNRMQVADTLSRLDCLLMTSHREGSPQIIKEAMVSGVPVISSNVGDVELLLDGVDNCYIINSFEAEDFVERVIELIKLKHDQRITNGRERIEAIGLDQRSVCLKVFELYKNIIGANALN